MTKRCSTFIILGVLLMFIGGCVSRPFAVVYQGKGMDRGVGLARVGDGGFLISGVSSSLGSGTESGLLVRVDERGRALWIESIEDSRVAAAWASVETSEGFTTVGFHSDSGGAPDCMLFSVDRDGKTEWMRSYGESGRERCWSLVSLNGDGYALAGEIVTNEEVHDCLLIRTDEDGQELWTRTYNKGQQERCFAIASTAEGGFLLAGQTSPDGGVERDVFLIGTDRSGEVLFEHVIGEEGMDLGHGVVAMDDGVIVVGYSATYGAEDVDPLLLKVSSSGEIAWTRSINIPGHARGLSVDAAPNGDLCVGGFRRTPAGETVPIVVRTTREGRKQWSRDLEGFDIGYTVVADRSGGCVITGHTSSGAEGDLDLFIARVTATGEQSRQISILPISGGDQRE